MNDGLLDSEWQRLAGRLPVDAETISVILELAAHDGCHHALDIAAGDSDTAFALAAIASRVVAVSTTAAIQAVPGGRVPAGAHMGRVLASPFTLPFADASFDLVTCRVAAHEFHRVRPALDEAVRVLTPSGIFLLADALTDRQAWTGGLEQSHLPPRCANRIHSPASWCRLLEEHGLLVDTTVTTLSAPDVITQPGTCTAAMTGSIGAVVRPSVAQTCGAGRDAALRLARWRGVVIRARKP
jgi:SAM-dependent methyltransferase